MDHAEISNLRTFLGREITNSGCNLYLPRFSGPVQLTSDQSATLPFRYLGGTFSERDTKAAFYITSMLGHVIDADKIRLEEASEFESKESGQAQTAFLFGSRSNKGTLWATEKLPTRKFFHFNFGAQWQICCVDGRVFSLPDPSKLERSTYSNEADYGVISRFSEPATEERFFVIAGLGSRATEGCGYYFSQHWRELFRKYGENDFAVILKFTPPIDPKKHEAVAWFGNEVIHAH